MARLGAARRVLREDSWRDAAAMVSLLTALLMLYVTGTTLPFAARMILAGESPLDVVAVYGEPLAVTLLRPAAWLAVLVAVLAGQRRTDAGLGVVALGVEVARFAAWPPIHLDIAMHLAWAPVLMLLAPALVVPVGHAVRWNAPQAPYAGNLAALLGILVVLPLVTLVVGARFGGRSRGHVEGP